MSSPRFTIAALMTLVAHVALGFAALRHADELWASVMFTAAVIATSFAVAGALVRRGPARLPWVGFALFAGFALLLPSGAASFPGGGMGMMSGMMGGGMSAAAEPAEPPALLPLWAFRTLQPILGPQGLSNTAAYAQISHSLQAILFGWLGALLYRLAAGRGDRLATALDRREVLAGPEHAPGGRRGRPPVLGDSEAEAPDQAGNSPTRPGAIAIQDREWDAILAEVQHVREAEPRGFD